MLVKIFSLTVLLLFGVLPVSLAVVSAGVTPESAAVSEGRVLGGDDDSIDAGLWRNEYLALDDLDVASSDAGGRAKAEAGLRVPNLKHRSSSNFLTSTDGLAGGVTMNFEADETTQLNDWDQAAANPDVKGQNGTPNSGPSLTSYIVGLVSTIVIIGGLVSGK